MWDGKKGTENPPTPIRLHGVKKATSIAVGETHLLIVSSLYHPGYLPGTSDSSQNVKIKDDELDELHEGFAFDDLELENDLPNTQKDDFANSSVLDSRNSYERSVPSLKSLCEKMAAVHLVEPRNVLQLLEIADSLGADDLKKHCEVCFAALSLGFTYNYFVIVLCNDSKEEKRL